MTEAPKTAACAHTPTPWFVSGVRFRMNGGEWQSVNRYNESKKQDDNIACVGYDPRTGAGLADAHFIVKAVNSYDAAQERIRELTEALVLAEDVLSRAPFSTALWPNGMHPQRGIEAIRAALSTARPIPEKEERK